MSDTPFSAHIRHEADKAVIDLQGEINAFADSDLNEAYDQAAAADPAAIILNFQAVEYINSTGIALIVGLMAQARKNHQQLVVYGLSDHYLEIFKITRLADFMTIFESEETALAG